MTMKKTAPLYGQKEEGRTLEDKVRIIRDTLTQHGREIQATHAIGMEAMTLAERVRHLMPAGRTLHQLVASYIQSAGLPDTTAERVKALDVFRQMRMTEDVAPADLTTIAMAARDTAVAPTATPAPSAPVTRDALTFSDGSPVPPGARDEAVRLGGGRRLERLREIASARQLDLTKPTGRAMAEHQLFAETSSTVSAAKSLLEAVFVLQKQDPKLSTRNATIRAGELRPDLRGTVGSGSVTEKHGGVVAFDETADPRVAVDRAVMAECNRRGLDFDDPRDHATAQQVVFSRRPELARALFFADRSHTTVRVDDMQATAFSEAVDAALQGKARTPENVKQASETVRKTKPHLVSVPGSGGRK